jgi:spore coat protein U-like protein
MAGTSQRLPGSIPRRRVCGACGVRAALLAATLGPIGLVHAATVSCLSATVTATGPAFGTYDPLNVSATNSNGSVTVTCNIPVSITAAASATVSLNAGSSGSFAMRKMLFGANPLSYNLYIDNAHTQVWGDGTGGSSAVADSFVFVLSGGLSQTVTTTIYGQIPASQLTVVPGSYSDTITVTVNY